MNQQLPAPRKGRLHSTVQNTATAPQSAADLDYLGGYFKRNLAANALMIRHGKILLGALVGLAMYDAVVLAGPTPPANDSCINATVVPSRVYSDVQNTTGASSDLDDPVPACGNNSRGKSVWYRFAVPESGPLTVDTFDSDYDTILSVYTGSCDALTPVPDGCSDDDPNDGAQSKVSLQAAIGTTYYFMVSAFDDDGGNLTFTLNLFREINTVTPSPTSTVTPTTTATVTSGPLGDANCDGRVTAPDLTALATLIGLNGRAPCRRDDTNDDAILDQRDVTGVIAAIFAAPLATM